MDEAPTLREFAKFQIPALRRDALRLVVWREGRGSDDDVLAIAGRLLKLHATIRERDWLPTSGTIVRGLEVLEDALDQKKPATQIGLLTNLLVAMTRAVLGDDPGPEPDGGPLAAQMAIGPRRRA